MNSSKPILLIEDNRVDATAVRRALEDLNVPNALVTAGHGQQALEYLCDRISEKPCVILLDLNMPRMDGIEFLHAVKSDEVLRTIPVVVLTTSHSKQDIDQSFDHGAAGYMTKPIDYKEFAEILNTINTYWSVSRLPNKA